jgi:thiamine biosynthesis protein ThiS
LFYMKLTVNGEEVTTGAGTVQALIEEMRLEPGRVAVEVNLRVVKKKDYVTFMLGEDDAVEIVSFVGGG